MQIDTIAVKPRLERAGILRYKANEMIPSASKAMMPWPRRAIEADNPAVRNAA
jgi:hypothetical protein